MSSTAFPPSCSSPMEKASLGYGLSDTERGDLYYGSHGCMYVLEIWVVVSGNIFWPTFFKGRAGGEGRPLSDGRVPLVAAAILSLAAAQNDVPAVEAQVLVGLAATALATQLQPQKAAVAALLKGRESR